MTRIPTSPVAQSADYHDALVAARRAKNWLFLLLLLGLLAQITVFFLVKFTKIVEIGPGNDATVTVPTVEKTDVPTSAPTTGESTTSTKSKVTFGEKTVSGGPLAWLVNSVLYLGTVFSIVMTILILLIVLVMLVGRLLGVAHSTSAFVWAVILAVLLFPWQLFYGPETARETAYAGASTTVQHNIDIDDFRVPGVLYTWGELVQGVKFDKNFDKVAILRYARFVGFPFVALIILFMVQAKSGRGVKYALGEAEVHVDVNTDNV